MCNISSSHPTVYRPKLSPRSLFKSTLYIFFLPVCLFYTDLDTLPGHINQWHWHDEIQFLVCISGQLSVTVEKEDFPLDSGDALFINADLLHTTRSINGTHAVYATLNIDFRLLASFAGSRMEQSYVLHLRSDPSLTAVRLNREIPWQAKILSDLDQIIKNLKEQPTAYELLVCARLYQVWAALICHRETLPQTAAHSLHHQQIKQILDLLHEEYTAPLSLDTLAAATGQHKSSLCRMFKQELHCTISAYLTTYRLVKSQELLLNTDLSITEIAYASGFQDTSYYIRKFKESMHCTPHQWRKLHR